MSALEFDYSSKLGLAAQVITTTLVFSACYVASLIWNRKHRYTLFQKYQIPTPEYSIIDGHFRLINPIEDDCAVFERLRQKLGPVYGVYIGDVPIIVVSDRNIIRDVFLHNNQCFTERTFLYIETELSHSILFAPYNRWRFMRKMLAHSFSRYTVRGAEATEFIEHNLEMMLDYMNQKSLESSAQGKPNIMNVQDLMKSVTLKTISDLAIRLPDLKIGENEPTVKQLDSFLSVCSEGMMTVVLYLPIFAHVGSFLAKHLEYDKCIGMINNTINKELQNGVRKLAAGAKKPGKTQHALDTMIQLYADGKLTQKEVIGNSQALLIAGYDTISTGLTYIFWAIAKHPEIQEQLRAELMAYGTNSDLLMAVINETMRIYPSVATFVSRRCTQTTWVNGQAIPQGAVLSVHTLLIHRDPNNWPDPMRFDPSRFTDGKTIDPTTFLPFGLGERKCVGYQLAELEMKMIVCDVLLRYKLKLVSPQNLVIRWYARSLTKPTEPIMIEFEKLKSFSQ